MPATPVIDVVSDATVALKWFTPRVSKRRSRPVPYLPDSANAPSPCNVLDLTAFELGNALLRGRLGVDGRVRFDVDTASLDAAVRHLSGFGIRALTSNPPTLEELFLRHYGDEVDQPDQPDNPGRHRSDRQSVR